MPNLHHAQIPLGSPLARTAVVNDNTTSNNALHLLLVVPSLSATSSDIHATYSSSLEPVEQYQQQNFCCDSEYIPAIAISPHHLTSSRDQPIWKLQSLSPFGVESCSETTHLSIGSLICLFDVELVKYTFGFERHVLHGHLVKTLWQEQGIQVYLMKVDRFTVTAAQISVEQATVYVVIPHYFIATSDLIAEMTPHSLGQEVGSAGQIIFPVRTWTHPLKAEIDWWYQQQSQREKQGEGVEYMQDGN
jgi:hypothetical protein